MPSRDEYYHKHALEAKIQEFIDEELNDHDLGYIPDNISRNMTEAAYAILAANKDINDYLVKENLLK